MKLDDIAKIAIDEVSAELKSIEMIDKKPPFQIIPPEHIEEKPTLENTRTDTLPTQNNEDEALCGEEIFLKNLRERIEVLFEGLSEIPKENLENRLDITLKFLEFALANVENRLNNIKK